MSKVIKLNERRAAKQYNEVYSQRCCNFDLRLDDVVQPRKERKDYAKMLAVGYMKLLSNQK